MSDGLGLCGKCCKAFEVHGMEVVSSFPTMHTTFVPEYSYVHSQQTSKYPTHEILPVPMMWPSLWISNSSCVDKMRVG